MLKNKPWIIWLSIIGFFILWSNSMRKIMTANRKLLDFINKPNTVNLWISFMGQTVLSMMFIFIVPIIIMGIIYEAIYSEFPNIAFTLEVVHYPIIYFLGVYATYRHVLWRNKNNIS